MRIFLLLALFWYSDFAGAQCPPDRIIPGEFLVRVESFRAHQAFIAQTRATNLIQRLTPANHLSSVFLVRGGNEQELRRVGGVLSVEPDCWVPPQSVTDDPGTPLQWSLDKIDALRHFDIVPKDLKPTLVAVTDSGVDVDHEDLFEVIFTNQVEERGIPGYDDDQNGCVDDIRGCDIVDATMSQV